MTIGDFFVGPAVTAGPPWYTLSLPSLTTITGDVDLYGLMAVDDVDLCNLAPPGGTRNFIGWPPMACSSLEAFLPLPWSSAFCDGGGTFVDFCVADCAGVVRGLALNGSHAAGRLPAWLDTVVFVCVPYPFVLFGLRKAHAYPAHVACVSRHV